MKCIALMTLALATIVGTANAGPVDAADRAASKFNLFPADLSVSLTALPLFVGGPSSVAQAINGNGEVVGFGQTSSSQRHAFYWSPSNPGVLVDIDPTGGDTVQAHGINDSGVVVGFKLDFFGTPQAFRWQGGTMTMLSPLSGFSGSKAFGVSNAGQVVGWSVEGMMERATLWQANNAVFDLGAQLGDGRSRAFAINEVGQVVGEYVTGGQLRAFLWTPGSGVTDLGTLGGSLATASDANDDGWVVGGSLNVDGIFHAFLWSSPSGPMVDLEPAGMSSASGLNTTPHAVGFSFASGQSRAIVWGSSGLRQDLGALDASDVSFAVARAINENGQIVGTSSDGTVMMRATLWALGEPTTPPSTACGTSVEEKIDCLIVQVQSMEGLSNQGQVRSLMAKLEAAKKKVTQAKAHAARGRQGAAEGNEQAANNILNAVRNQVHAFVLAGLLTDQDEDAVAKIINP